MKNKIYDQMIALELGQIAFLPLSSCKTINSTSNEDVSMKLLQNTVGRNMKFHWFCSFTSQRNLKFYIH